jgi:hypothetical protein
MSSEGPKPPKKAMSARESNSRRVVVHLETKLWEAIDALTKELSTGWHQANRSDALRMIILEGLQAHKQGK